MKHALADAEMLSFLPLSFLQIDRNLNIANVNHAAEALLKKAAKELTGQSLCALFPASELPHMAQDTLQHGTTTRIQQMEIPLPYGEKIQATLHLAPLWKEEQPEPTGAMLMIDPLQHAEHFLKKKVQQEKSRTTGLAAAMLAHEIKNPLSSIRSAAQLLKEELHIPSPACVGGLGWGKTADHENVAPQNSPHLAPPRKREEELSAYPQLIIREVDRIAGMMQRLEYLSHEAQPELLPVNIHEILRYAVSVLSPELQKRMTVKERFDPSLPPVAGDKDLLIQLFLNVIKNAAEAMAETQKATLLMTTRIGQDFRIVHGNKRTLPIYIDIEDNGPGLPDEVSAQLFTPFVTTKKGGNGLGLVIAAKIANDHGGAIEVKESRPGRTLLKTTLIAHSL